MRYHGTIFYPEERSELLSLVEAEKDSDPIRAAILPHMGLWQCQEAYRSVFRAIPDGKRIIALLPLHRPPLERDGGSIMFESKEEAEDTPLGEVRIGTFGLGDASAYEKEEYTRELLLPYAAYFTPSSTLHAIYTYVKKSEDMKKLRHFLSSMDDGNTVFLISSNMTGRLQEDEMRWMRSSTIDAILEGGHLLDKWRKGRIGACATAEIESVSAILGGRWELIWTREEDSICGHAGFIMR